MKSYRSKSPSESMGVPKRGIVPPFEAHRERSEPCSFRKSCARQKEVFGI